MFINLVTLPPTFIQGPQGLMNPNLPRWLLGALGCRRMPRAAISNIAR